MNWIGLITNLLTVVNVLVCLLIILLVLLQRPKDQGLGAAFGGDTASNIFGAQTTNVLASLTRWLCGIFLGLCLLIAVLGTFDKSRQGKISAYIKKLEAEQAERDKQKAAEEAAKAAAAKNAVKPPQVPSDATAPSAKPDESKPADNPAAPKPEDAKPAVPSTPATPTAPPVTPAVPDLKPAEPKPGTDK